MTNKNKLRARIIEKGYKQESIAQKLGISAQSVNYKINNKRPFTTDEMFVLCEILEIENPRDYFFAQVVEEKSTNKQ